MLIHRYWHGENQPEITDGSALWTDESLPMSTVAWLNDRMDLSHSPLRRNHHRSNMVRWYLLYEHGGIWLDCDLPIPNPMPELPFAGWTLNRFRVGAMGFPPDHPIPAYALAALDANRSRPTSAETSGSVLLREAIEATDATLNRWELPCL